MDLKFGSLTPDALPLDGSGAFKGPDIEGESSPPANGLAVLITDGLIEVNQMNINEPSRGVNHDPVEIIVNSRDGEPNVTQHLIRSAVGPRGW